MAKFRDKVGDDWNVYVDLERSRRLAKVVGIDILDPNSYQDMLNSLGIRIEYLWNLVRDQASDNGCEDFASFERRLHGGRINDASDALQEAFIAFFQRLGVQGLVLLADSNLEAMKNARGQLSAALASAKKDKKKTSERTGKSYSGSLPSAESPGGDN